MGKGRKMSRLCRRTICAVLSVLLVISVLTGTGNGWKRVEAKGKYNGRVINVVYDDSGSMVKTDGTLIPRWSQAKYSLEVFAAMLSETDTMNVYPMSMEGGLGFTLKGTDKNRVSTVHDMNAKYWNTPFTTVEAAGEDLLGRGTDVERWLVIITDGAFDDGDTPLEKVQSTIDSYLEKGIKVAYLGIGDSASVLNADPGRGFYTEKAADGIDVLNKVTSIANQIFSHLVLPGDCIKQNGDKYSLSIDIPTGQVIVFAQGDNASIGEMTANGTAVKPTELQNVKYSDVKPENFQDAEVDTSLKGVVAIFDSGEDPFAEGEFNVSVSGAQTVEFYYQPGVVVNAQLSYNGNPVMQDAELYEGDYEVSMNFLNPLTNMPVQSKLLDGAEFSLSVTNNGETKKLGADHGSLHLVEGGVDLEATAELPGHLELSDTKHYEVLPEPIELKLDFEMNRGSFTGVEVANGDASVKMTVTNAQDGSPLSDEAWKATQVSVSEVGGVQWDIKPGEEVSTWILTTKSPDGDAAGIAQGMLEFTASADYQVGGQYAHGTGGFGFNVIAKKNEKMSLEVVSIPEYSLIDLETEPGIVVKAYIGEDPEDRQVIDEELWNNMVLTVTTEKKIEFRFEKGTEVGEFLIYPMYYETDKDGWLSWIPKSHDRKALKTDSGEIPISISGDAESVDRAYHGETEAKINVRELSFLEKLKVLYPVLILIALILFIIIGYIVKHRIPKKMNPRCSYKSSVSSKKKIKKKPMSVFLPYVDERATVYCHDDAHECHFSNLRIRAVSKTGFKIQNANLPLKEITINDMEYEDMKAVKAQLFQYRIFRITSIDLKHHGRDLGTFEFFSSDN